MIFELLKIKAIAKYVVKVANTAATVSQDRLLSRQTLRPYGKTRRYVTIALIT